MCTIQERDEILTKPILKYSDVAKLVGCGDGYAYTTIIEIRAWMEKQGKPLPHGQRITSTAFKQYFEIQ